MKSRAYELSGQRFGHLIAIEKKGVNRHRCVLWLCQCDCGQKKIAASHGLVMGDTTSCGCVASAKKRAANVSHGRSNTPIYGAWLGMKNRCTIPNDRDFPNYGGRGIGVCERWRHSFENFLADMGERPAGKTLDRIDNNKGYEPNNCRWATRVEQNNNRRSCCLLKHDGRTLTISQWAREIGIPHNTLRSRVRAGWSADKALTTIVLSRGAT